MKKNICILLFLCSLFCFKANAQSKKIAQKYFDSFAYVKAIKMYSAIWNKDSSDYYITHQLASAYRLTNNTEKSEEWYAKIINQSSDPDDYYHYAKALEANEKYDQANIWIEKYNQTNQHKIKYRTASLDYLSELNKRSSQFEIFPVEVNSEYSDFGPVFYLDDIVISSTRKRYAIIKREDQWNEQAYTDLYLCKKTQSGNLSDIDLFKKSVFKTKLHNGPVCFNTGGDEIFITQNTPAKEKIRGRKKIRNLKLYHSKKENGKWTTPQLMSVNKEGYSSGHPSLSADGKHLYFTSDRPGGYGGKDLYVSTKEENKWTEAENLGPQINSPADDMFPFISNENKLYFASNGHRGIGGLDIFTIDLNKKERASVVNMGGKINTSKDDFGLIIKDNEGYFASNRILGESFDDVYYFKIKNYILNGLVLNSETNNPIANSSVSIFDKDGSLLKIIKTDSTGQFSFSLAKGKSVNLKAEKDFFSDSFLTVDQSNITDDTDIYTEIRQTPVETNLLYDFDKSSLRVDASSELFKIFTALNENTELKIEIEAHTDSRGSHKYNMKLAEKRAQAVVKYLVSKGISADRIITKAYGETQLLNKCSDGIQCSEKEHQENRRATIKILYPK